MLIQGIVHPYGSDLLGLGRDKELSRLIGTLGNTVHRGYPHIDIAIDAVEIGDIIPISLTDVRERKIV